MDPTAEPTDGESTEAERSEPEFVTPRVTAAEPVDPQADATQVAAPDAGEHSAPAASEPPAPAASEPPAPQAGEPPAPQAGEPPAPDDDWPDNDWPDNEGPDDEGPDDGWLIETPPSQESFFDRHRTPVVLASIGVALLIGVIAFVVAALTQSANSTLNVRVIVPAPASAGGLSRDFTDENTPQFQAGLEQFRQRYASKLAQHIASYTAAIYTNAAAGQPATTASVGVLYLGFNSAEETLNPTTAVSESIRSIETSFGGSASTVKVSGLPGDTSAECVGSVLSGNPVAICVWATDKTAALIATLIPETDLKLAAVLKKMQPDLVRG